MTSTCHPGGLQERAKVGTVLATEKSMVFLTFFILVSLYRNVDHLLQNKEIELNLNEAFYVTQAYTLNKYDGRPTYKKTLDHTAIYYGGRMKQQPVLFPEDTEEKLLRSTSPDCPAKVFQRSVHYTLSILFYSIFIFYSRIPRKHRVHRGKWVVYLPSQLKHSHHNFVSDGRYSEREVGVHPPPSPGWSNFSIMIDGMYAKKWQLPLCMHSVLGSHLEVLRVFILAIHSHLYSTNGFLCTGDPYYIPYTLLLIS